MRPRLLIADSNAASRDLRQRFFAACGFEVLEADSGLECLELLRERQPHVMLLEAGLLWGSAAGVVALLRESRDLGPLPVVLVGSREALADRQLAGWPVVARHETPLRIGQVLQSIQAAAQHDPEIIDLVGLARQPA